MCFVSLEGDLQDTVTQPVAVETGDGHGRLVIIRHGDEAEAFAFVGVEVTDHLDIVDGTKRPEQLPENALVRIWGQVVHKDAPTGARVARDVHSNQAGHAVNGDGREPERRGRAGGKHGGRAERKGERRKQVLIEHVKAHSESQCVCHEVVNSLSPACFYLTYSSNSIVLQILKLAMALTCVTHYCLQLYERKGFDSLGWEIFSVYQSQRR